MRIVSFLTSACGQNADHAFHNAVTLAQADHGINGNTGTIADKKEYRMVTPKKDKNPFDWAREQLDFEDVQEADIVSCIDLNDGEYIFFGKAFRAGMELEEEITFL